MRMEIRIFIDQFGQAELFGFLSAMKRGNPRITPTIARMLMEKGYSALKAEGHENPLEQALAAAIGVTKTEDGPIEGGPRKPTDAPGKAVPDADRSAHRSTNAPRAAIARQGSVSRVNPAQDQVPLDEPPDPLEAGVALAAEMVRSGAIKFYSASEKKVE